MEDKDTEISAILTEIQTTRHLTIIKLSEPFCAEDDPNNAKRESDVSADARENTSVANLEAELEHYKDLFSKLRFSYVEQVTKEKFLRAIVSDPPLLVEPHENSELEAQLKDAKAHLKTQKEGVAQLTKELEAQGRELAQSKFTLYWTPAEGLMCGYKGTSEYGYKQQNYPDYPPKSQTLSLPSRIYGPRPRQHQIIPT